MGDGTGGGGSADSYIGSLISLTSKSEIRYEGILYTVDTEKSNIALQDVRSFGTEGRKKDGPQIPASDKIYDYIIFRGSDIKDLQVKSSPPIQPSQVQPHHDPAIISMQSQFSQPASMASSFVPSGTGTLPDGVNPGPYPSIPSAAYQSNMPSMYPPGAGLGSWALPPAPPGANGSLPMPMYWQGYYRPPSGISHLPQQLPMPFQTAPMLPGTYLPQAPTMPQQQLSAATSLPTAIPASVATLLAPLQQRNVPVISSKDSLVTAAVSSDIEACSTASPALTSAVLLADTTLTSSVEEKISGTATAGKLAEQIVGPPFPSSQSVGSFPGQSTTVHLSTSALPSTLLAPGQLLHPGALLDPVKTLVATSQSSISEQRSTEPATTVAPLISTPPPSQPQKAVNQPLLPLPTLPTLSVNPPHHKQGNRANGSLGNNAYMRRGRGRERGIGTLHPQKQFTEDFDFTAMNEKFNKDEVWGELGKGDSRDKGDGDEDAAEDGHEEEDLPRVPIYVKDDFFDSISCDALGRGGQAERTKFSQQRKIDTETFGSFPVRSRSSRGGRGGYRGSFRGSYYGGQGIGRGGRGNGNGGRGRFSRSPGVI